MKALWGILLAFLAATTVYLLIGAFFSDRLTAASQATWAAMDASSFECPAATELRTEGWGKSGYSRTCAALKDGPWEAWEDGYMHITGSYRSGKEDGRWTFYNSDGSISHVIEYKNGVEVPSTSGR